jgi:formamidopyrimidine-DNA glycosylase
VPELPEVETVRAGLERLIVGATIASVEPLQPSSLRGDVASALGRRVLGARRRGKVLIVDLQDGYSLVAHLKMTGQLVFRPATAAASSAASPAPARLGKATGSSPDPVAAPTPATPSAHTASGRAPGPAGPPPAGPAASAQPLAPGPTAPPGAWGGGHPSDSLIGPLPDNSTRVIIGFADGARLYFNDQRKFGWLAVMPTDQVEEIPLLAKMGPEPFEQEAWPEFRRRARRHQRAPVKAVLLDQSVVAGIGNIYADEALWAARIHPETPVGALSDRALKRLLEAAAEVMALSLSLGGSTDRNYVDAEGRRGAYLDFAKVFRRQGQPCERCGRPILKTRVAGRGTHLCARCQRRRPLAPPTPKP